MLRALHISGLGVIEDLGLDLHGGLNVLTGETGAGKTMVTVGLGLALGARASASLVRSGDDAARVEALFDPAEADAEDGAEVVLSRSVTAAGRGSARISGELATASMLATIGGELVEVHGQGQTQRLLAAAMQTELLDRFAGSAQLSMVEDYRRAFAGLREASVALEELREAERDRERELDLLAYQVREIEAVAPVPDEQAALEAEESRFAHAERLLEQAATVAGILDGDGTETAGATEGLARVSGELDEAAALDPDARGLADRARGLAVEAAELARDVRGYGDGLTHDPVRLQQVRERLAALGDLRRKYGDTTEEVLAFLASAAERLDLLTNAAGRSEELQERVGTLTAEARAAAEAMTAARTEAAPRLGDAITAELGELGMPGSRIEVALEPERELGPGGAEHVELRLAAGPDHAPGALATTASGGELSRVMLACRSVLGALDDTPTLVFDEIDAGIGGRAGLAVGKRLARLARDRQVLVVTHLPQIACFADRHIRIVKDGSVTSARALEDEERVVELSRMLAGLEDSASAHSHAEELLAEADRVRAGFAAART